MKRKISCLLAVLVTLAGGCAEDRGYKLPGVYRIDIQQGNVVEQEMIARLKPGMDKIQVRLIMGTPVLVDPFHSNRWEYVYTFSRKGGRREQRHITLYFENDKLDYVQGDVVPGDNIEVEEGLKQTRTVDVPLKSGRKRKGFFRNVFGFLPFVGDDEPAAKKGEFEEYDNPRDESPEDERLQREDEITDPDKPDT